MSVNGYTNEMMRGIILSYSKTDGALEMWIDWHDRKHNSKRNSYDNGINGNYL